EWLVASGDTVAEDQPLAVVMTDKASVEIPSPVAGTVARLAGEVGQMLAVGAELITIEVGEARAVAAAAAPAMASAMAAPEPPVRRGGEKPLASPSVRRHARERGIDLRQVPGSGPGGRIRHEDVEIFAARSASMHPVSGPVAPSQPAVSVRGAAPVPAPAVVPALARGHARYAERNDEQAIPVIRLRRRIAEALQDAKWVYPPYIF